MSERSIAIELKRISKCFSSYHRPVDRLKELLLPVKSQADIFWALKDINLVIPKGSTVGIIGRNGSGKSTLLQIIARTLSPTEGELSVNGRVAALLELGSGFNPEFTGRQNVFFNGQILGLDRETLESLFDEIIQFADIGDFIDRPVKTYSSGMTVRLAFSVATASTPDILIVDEALSVGDEAFQRKCFARIKDIQESGSTVLFVSHSAASIVELCDAAILIDSGELLLQGYPKMVVSQYQKLAYAPAHELSNLRETVRQLNQRVHEQDEFLLFSQSQKEESDNLRLEAKAAQQEPRVDSSNQEVGSSNQKSVEAAHEIDDFDPNLIPKSTVSYISRGAEIVDPHITNLQKEPVNILISGQEYLYRYRVKFDTGAHKVRFGMMIKTVSGLDLGGGVSHPFNKPLEAIEQDSTVDVEFRFTCSLQTGTYFMNAGVVARIEGQEVFLARKLDVAMFRVEPIEDCCFTGLVDFQIKSSLSTQMSQKVLSSVSPVKA